MPSFRGVGPLYQRRLSRYEFEENLPFAWQYHRALKEIAADVQPNGAHYALSELARKKEGFVTISQNIDGLCERANHPSERLHLIHGSLYKTRCTSCAYSETAYPPSLVPSTVNWQNDTTRSQVNVRWVHWADFPSDVPRCQHCGADLRPGVVWMYEQLPLNVLETVDKWMGDGPVDLMLVIGTSLTVFPAAEYVELARSKGARIAIVDMDEDIDLTADLQSGDWFFKGDAAVIVPEMLKTVIGEINS